MCRDELREIVHIGDMRENGVSEFRPIIHDLKTVALQIIYQTHVLWSVQHLIARISSIVYVVIKIRFFSLQDTTYDSGRLGSQSIVISSSVDPRIGQIDCEPVVLLPTPEPCNVEHSTAYFTKIVYVVENVISFVR